jgi:hypothetical protein
LINNIQLKDKVECDVPAVVAAVPIYQSTCTGEDVMTLCGIQYVAAVRSKLLCDCSFAYFKQNTDLYLSPAVAEGKYFSLLGVVVREIEDKCNN